MKKRPFTPVTFEDLKALFTNPTFISRLDETRRDILDYRSEGSFSVIRGPYGKNPAIGKVVSYKDVAKRPNDTAPGDPGKGFKEDESVINLKDLDGRLIFLTTHHSHSPEKFSSNFLETTAEPSENDLLEMAGLRKGPFDYEGYRHDTTPLYLIGSLLDEKILNILVLQEKCKTPMREVGAKTVADFLDSKLNTSFSQDSLLDTLSDLTVDESDLTDFLRLNPAIARACNETPYLRATVLTYLLNKKGKLEIPPGELKKLEDFAFTPKWIED